MPPTPEATPTAWTSTATSPTAGALSAASEFSGPGYLSEPESQAVYRLVQATRPDVTIWFHQPFGLIDRPEGNPFAAKRFSELIGLPLHRLPGPYPGSASRWQNHEQPENTAFVAELPKNVSSSLARRGVAAVCTLAAELASPAIDYRLPISDAMSAAACLASAKSIEVFGS